MRDIGAKERFALNSLIPLLRILAQYVHQFSQSCPNSPYSPPTSFSINDRFSHEVGNSYKWT